ncbi:hypothetical protein GCM10007856_29700 [Azospirillum oryzae]|nr:hypothetical protein GCM10007856_29700 [Azospirillum oryzae]
MGHCELLNEAAHEELSVREIERRIYTVNSSVMVRAEQHHVGQRILTAATEPADTVRPADLRAKP